MPANAMITYYGNVFWPIPTKLLSTCKVDVTYFPFDEQFCLLKFGSWTYDGFQVIQSGTCVVLVNTSPAGVEHLLAMCCCFSRLFPSFLFRFLIVSQWPRETVKEFGECS